MIIRLVKLEIHPEHVETFEAIFGRVAPQIRTMQGCRGVELLKDIHHTGTFFTISRWNREVDLENYRSSPLFRNTWQQVKPLFAKPAKAWSMVKVNE